MVAMYGYVRVCIVSELLAYLYYAGVDSVLFPVRLKYDFLELLMQF